MVGIASGAIILRRTGGDARVRVLRTRQRPFDGGEQVERMLAAFGRYADAADAALPQTRFRLVEPHDLAQRLAFEDGSYRAGAAT